MTPQQERIAQAEHHEHEARVVKSGINVLARTFKTEANNLRRYQRYLERTARQNRRAHERNSH